MRASTCLPPWSRRSSSPAFVRAYGRRLLRSLPKRAAADILTLLPPAIVSVLLYELVAKPWIRPLNHLPEFYFVPGTETAAAFLTRNLWNVFNLFSPVLLWSPRRAAVLVLSFAAGVLLAMTTEKPRNARAERAMPAAVLAILLGSGMVLGILGKYPFGGVRRQQFLLFLFGLLAGFMALDRLRRAVPSAGVRRALAAVTAAAVLGSFAAHLGDLRTPGTEAFGVQSRVFHREFPDAKLVQVDQLNLIGFFMAHHDWDWTFLGRETGNPSVERYRLEKAGRPLTLVAHRDRWNFNFSDPALFASLRAARKEGDPRCFSVFCVHTNLYKPPERRLPDLDPGRIEADIAAFARSQGESARKVVLRGNDVYAELCPVDEAR